MCTCPDDQADFTHYVRRKARTSHRCIECDCTIAPGTVYEHVAMGWEGTVESYSECVDCAAWGSAFARAQGVACGCSGWELGAMWDEIEEFTREHLYYDPKTGRELTRPKGAQRNQFVVMGDMGAA